MFTIFERVVNFIYIYILKTDKKDVVMANQLIITLISGYISGIFCALVSHPADTVITKINQRRNVGFSGTIALLRELGWCGVWSGVGLRIFIIGTLTGLQWVIYDTFKVLVGFPTTGTSSVH